MEIFRIMRSCYRIILVLTIGLISVFFCPSSYADSAIDNGAKFLESKQDVSGAVNGGFSSPSQWSSIALSANGLDVNALKIASDSASLKDYLVTDVPGAGSLSTDWESRILSIVAIGGDPTNFGGVNYLEKLKGFQDNNQIGNACALNDDIFGLLALIASGNAVDTKIKRNELDFIVSQQDPTDGGFSWSAPSCPWYGTAPDMTAAAIQALQAAKNNNLVNDGLDQALSKAKKYLFANQNSDGGFGYYGSSDADTTGWVLMALNVLNLKEDPVAKNTRSWLVSQQQADGGFLSYSGEDSTTTAQAVIALVGQGWVLKIFDLPSLPTPPPPATPSAEATKPETVSPPTPTIINSTDLLSLLNSGYFSIPPTATTSSTPSINVNQQITINTPSGSGTSSVIIPKGATIRRSDGLNIDLSTLSVTSVSIGALSGYSPNLTVDGVLQWGIPGIGLDFTSPITVNIYVGPNFNGQTLSVQRSTSGAGDWTSDGIVDPKACLVSAGTCSFQAIKASYYVTVYLSPTVSSSDSSNKTSANTLGATASSTTVTSSTNQRLKSVVAKKRFSGIQASLSQPTVLGEATTSRTISKTIPKAIKTNRGKSLILFLLSVSCFSAAFLFWKLKIRR